MVRVLGDGYKGLMEENSSYGELGVLWDYLWRSVGFFSNGGDIGWVDGRDKNGLSVWVEVWEMFVFMSIF